MAYIPAATEPTAYAFAPDSLILDFEGSTFIVDGGEEEITFTRHLRDLSAVISTAPNKSGLVNAVVQHEKYGSAAVGNFPKAKEAGAEGSVRSHAHHLQQALHKTGSSALPLQFTPKYEPTLLYKNLGRGELKVYVLSGGVKPYLDALEKAVASGTEEHIEKVAADYGLILAFVWLPAKADGKVKRILYTGSASADRVVEVLEASEALSLLCVPSATSATVRTGVKLPPKVAAVRTASGTARPAAAKPTTPTAARPAAPAGRVPAPPKPARAAPPATRTTVTKMTTVAPAKPASARTSLPSAGRPAAPAARPASSRTSTGPARTAAPARTSTSTTANAAAKKAGPPARGAPTKPATGAESPAKKIVAKSAAASAPKAEASPVEKVAPVPAAAPIHEEPKITVAAPIIHEIHDNLLGDLDTTDEELSNDSIIYGGMVRPILHCDLMAPPPPCINIHPATPEPFADSSCFAESVPEPVHHEEAAKNQEHEPSPVSHHDESPVKEPSPLPELATPGETASTDSLVDFNAAISEPSPVTEEHLEALAHSSVTHEDSPVPETLVKEPSEPKEDDHKSEEPSETPVPENFVAPHVPQQPGDGGLLDDLEEPSTLRRISMDTDKLKETLEGFETKEGSVPPETESEHHEHKSFTPEPVEAAKPADEDVLVQVDTVVETTGPVDESPAEVARKISQQLIDSAALPFTSAIASSITEHSSTFVQKAEDLADHVSCAALDASSVISEAMSDAVENITDKLKAMQSRSSIVENNGDDDHKEYEKTDPVIDSVLDSVATQSEFLDRQLSTQEDSHVPTNGVKDNHHEDGWKSTDAFSNDQPLHLAPVKKAKVQLSRPRYFELVTVPHKNGQCSLTDKHQALEFFSAIRATSYLLASKDLPAFVLEALFEAKKTWKNDMKTTVFPTESSPDLQRFISNHKIDMADNGLTISSTIVSLKMTITTDDTAFDYHFARITL